jgi:hypothetical protein
MTPMVKLADVQVVIYARRMLRFHSRRKVTGAAQMACASALQDFEWRAMPARWTRLVAASRKLHAIVNAEREDLET